jgi:two-component system chemotaxis response regulator CheB
MAPKVLVVDDSALMRKHLKLVLEQAGFELVFARTGREAVEQVLATQPDVVTLDINMPEMDGLTALSLIMAARPTPVVMVSSLTSQGALATLEALAMGAVDFVAKPGGTISLSLTEVAEELVSKVRAAARSRLKAAPARPAIGLSERLRAQRVEAASGFKRQPDPVPGDFGLVLVGVSTGGPRTLEEILPQLPPDLPWPVLVAQHMPASFTATFAARLDSLCALRVKELERMEALEPGTVYIARGGTDMVVAERLGRLVALARPESAKHLWHPSVDALVESALAIVPPARLIGVQLTGMGYDGAEAMARLKRRGGRTIAESEDSAVVFGMPKELIERGGASLVLPAHKVATQIVRWLH